jgi:hypothetical protein
MAFTIEGEKKSNGLIRLVGIIVAIIVFLFATYYLFFTKPPQIEVFVPRELMTISQISDLDIDPSTIINSAVYRSLKEHFPPPQFGEFGRLNPFSSF